MKFDYKYILWDFDGVIIDSDKARVSGFIKVLENYPKEQVDQLLEFHAKNGGLSRYVKFRYFFEQIRLESVSEERVNDLAEEFSKIMRITLTSPQLLIEDTCAFIRENYKNIPMHIVSGSDGNELRFLNEQLGLERYFKTIQGSPIPKIKLVENLINAGEINPSSTCLIGDALNDFDAAHANGVDFCGYNNEQLIGVGNGYITTFGQIQLFY
jgi:phosphoglycolate phosphatase-like HAD superfamily hydrolase